MEEKHSFSSMVFCAKSVDGHRILWFVIGNFLMFPLRHGALFVVFCAEPACFVKNVHLLLCIFAAAPSHGVHGLKS